MTHLNHIIARVAIWSAKRRDRNLFLVGWMTAMGASIWSAMLPIAYPSISKTVAQTLFWAGAATFLAFGLWGACLFGSWIARKAIDGRTFHGHGFHGHGFRGIARKR
jgi:hypothetical protein